MRRFIPLLFSLIVLGALAPAAAQTPGDAADATERAVALASPSVSFIQTSLTVRIRVTYQDFTKISGLGQITERYWLDWATGSGFTVRPDGTIVTASHVVEPNQRDVKTYAANQMLLIGGGYNIDDLYTRYQVTDDFAMNRLLQQCYRGVACDYTIKPTVQVYSAADVARSEFPVGLPARVVSSTGFKETDVAVLKVDTQNMPTVQLADSSAVESGDELVALGFPGSAQSLPTGVTEPTKMFGRVSNVRSTGTTSQIEVDMDVEPGMSGGPVINDAGQVIGLTSWRFLQETGESGQVYLRTVDDIRASLSDAGLDAETGVVDSTFAEAMDMYWGSHFTAAVPLFNKVLALYDGHPLAKSYLAKAQAEAGGPADVPVAEEQPSKPASGESSGPPWLWIGLGAGAMLLLAALGFTMRRRSRAVPVTTPSAPVVEAEVAPARHLAPVPQAEELHFCPECGGSIDPADHFCGHCGHVIHHPSSHAG